MSDETAEKGDAEGAADAGEAPEEAAPPSAEPAPSRWARLHTLSGGFVLAAFVIEHLFTNASALGGAATFDAVVGSILRLRLLPLIELVFIVVPLAFHAGYGIYLLRRRTADEVVMNRYGDRRLWTVQRISASVVFLFVLGHFWELRAQRLFFGASPDSVYSTLTAHLSWTWGGVPWIALGYLLGIFAVAVHLANGLYAATAAWQVALDPTGRRRARMLSLALGLILFVTGAATVIGLATGTRLLPGADGDSAPQAPCGSAAVGAPPFKLPTPFPPSSARP